MRSPLLALLAGSAAIAAAASNATTRTHLTATAIVTNAQNASALQCWRFTEAMDAPVGAGGGAAGPLQLGLEIEGSGVQYAVVPPRFDEGVHNAPVPGFVFLASGLAHFTAPNSDTEAYLLGGKNGLIFAADTTGPGHRTRYPGDESTVTVFLPVVDGKAPAHEVLGEGPCLHQDGTQLVVGV